MRRDRERRNGGGSAACVKMGLTHREEGQGEEEWRRQCCMCEDGSNSQGGGTGRGGMEEGFSDPIVCKGGLKWGLHGAGIERRGWGKVSING